MSISDDISLSEVHGTINTEKRGWKKLFSFLGPAYLVSVGYMDPGNWATDIAGGSQFGYSLIWVLLMSNLMAVFLQGLSSRLGIVRGRDLAQANREAYPPFINFILYVIAELAIAACDLAEVLGMAIGIQLLTGLPLIWGVSITVLDTFLLLFLQRLGMRKMEAFIITLVAIIALCFLLQIIMAKPDPSEVMSGFIPSFASEHALYIAIGIIGATIMPHNLYLHSALVQTRKIKQSESSIRQAIRYNRIDSVLALNIAFLVNAAILVLAAAVFYKTGNSHVGTIKEAHRLLPDFLGKSAPFLFAIALIAAGQSSTITGTLAGQIVMEGYLRLRINPLLRRLLTRLIAVVPAFLVIWINGENEVDYLLVLSQVILSVQLGFAIIPLIHFVSDKKKMGGFAIGWKARLTAWIIATIIIALNIKMLYNEIAAIFSKSSVSLQCIIILSILGLSSLLIYILLHPIFGKEKSLPKMDMHPSEGEILNLPLPSFKKIAIALEFGESDSNLISHALAQGKADTNFILIHIVESASAIMSGTDSYDLEAQKDKERMDSYVDQLRQKGFNASGILGFRNRKREIVRIVNHEEADLLIMGAHRHKGLLDFVYGETVNAVRHELRIPVMIVNV